MILQWVYDNYITRLCNSTTSLQRVYNESTMWETSGDWWYDEVYDVRSVMWQDDHDSHKQTSADQKFYSPIRTTYKQTHILQKQTW